MYKWSLLSTVVMMAQILLLSVDNYSIEARYIWATISIQQVIQARQSRIMIGYIQDVQIIGGEVSTKW